MACTFAQQRFPWPKLTSPLCRRCLLRLVRFREFVVWTLALTLARRSKGHNGNTPGHPNRVMIHTNLVRSFRASILCSSLTFAFARRRTKSNVGLKSDDVDCPFPLAPLRTFLVVTRCSCIHHTSSTPSKSAVGCSASEREILRRPARTTASSHARVAVSSLHRKDL